MIRWLHPTVRMHENTTGSVLMRPVTQHRVSGTDIGNGFFRSVCFRTHRCILKCGGTSLWFALMLVPPHWEKKRNSCETLPYANTLPYTGNGMRRNNGVVAEMESFKLSNVKGLYFLPISNCRPRILCVSFVSAYTLMFQKRKKIQCSSSWRVSLQYKKEEIMG